MFSARKYICRILGKGRRGCQGSADAEVLVNMNNSRSCTGFFQRVIGALFSPSIPISRTIMMFLCIWQNSLSEQTACPALLSLASASLDFMLIQLMCLGIGLFFVCSVSAVHNKPPSLLIICNKCSAIANYTASLLSFFCEVAFSTTSIKVSQPAWLLYFTI